jgi:hypothetical protein
MLHMNIVAVCFSDSCAIPCKVAEVEVIMESVRQVRLSLDPSK